MKLSVRISRMRGVAAALAISAACSCLSPAPATAGGGDLAAGLLGGLAVGTVVGAAAAQPRYYYPPPYYAPAPVYVPAPRCWFERQRVWDGYGYVLERIRVCE